MAAFGLSNVLFQHNMHMPCGPHKSGTRHTPPGGAPGERGGGGRAGTPPLTWPSSSPSCHSCACAPLTHERLTGAAHAQRRAWPGAFLRQAVHQRAQNTA
eukprot:118845-Chlamydomonas_euryale.AAC.5